jgi:hypothetical protein
MTAYLLPTEVWVFYCSNPTTTDFKVVIPISQDIVVSSFSYFLNNKLKVARAAIQWAADESRSYTVNVQAAFYLFRGYSDY